MVTISHKIKAGHHKFYTTVTRHLLGGKFRTKEPTNLQKLETWISASNMTVDG